MGAENRARLRECDLSLTGLHVETEVDSLEPGAVATLRMRSRDRETKLETPARVVRVLRSDDLLTGPRVSGVAFEFLCYEPGKREELAAFVLQIARVARPKSEPPGDAGLSVETGWQLRRGERVRIEVPSPNGGTVRLEGTAVRSRRKPSGAFRTQLELADETVFPCEPAREITGIRESMRAVDASAVRALAPVHLSGDLAAIRLPSVLSVIALERFSGELRLRKGGERATIYLRDGQIVDCDGPLEGETPLTSLARLIEWSEGRFELSVVTCERADVIGTSTTALLLDLARELDENQRVA